MRAIARLLTTPQMRKSIRNFYDSTLRQAKGRSSRKKRFSEFSAPYKLHLGCGDVSLKGFCNVDTLATSAADIVDDIRNLRFFKNSSVSEIYACHVLEHFGHNEIEPILKRWLEILEPGGIIRISVPDMDRIVDIYSRNLTHFHTPGNTPWIGLIYGGQTTPYDFHKTGFNECWLKCLLETSGYESVETYPHEPHFVPGTIDASLANQPFGDFISLNIMARRPR